MRNQGNSRNTITATPRQLESMIRLAEATAKMELSDTVEKKHIQEAHRLIQVALRQSATNPMTGMIDMDLLTTGISTTSKETVTQIVEVIKEVLGAHEDMIMKKGLRYWRLFDHVNTKIKLNEQKVTHNKDENMVTDIEFRDALRVLEEEEKISLVGHTQQPTIRLVQ